MNLSDMVAGRKQAPEDNGPLVKRTDFNRPLTERTGFMNMRKFQPSESSTGQASHGAGYERGIDNLIQGLVDLLPKRDGIWPLEERAKWLRLAAGIFDLGYKAGDGERREINIAVVKQEVTSRPQTAAREETITGARFGGRTDGAHEGRRPRQRHALAAQQHGGLFGPFVLGKRARVFRSQGATIPVALSAFPNETYQAPRAWVERTFPS